MVDAIGTDTVRSLASGPQDHQVKMLKALGLQSTLITDGRNPINLFSTDEDTGEMCQSSMKAKQGTVMIELDPRLLTFFHVHNGLEW